MRSSRHRQGRAFRVFCCGLIAATWASFGLGATARAQTVLKGAQVHTVSGPIIEKGVVIIGKDGRIAAVGGPQLAIPDGAKVVDASGMVVTPGLVDAHTELGLVEISAVANTRDANPGGKDIDGLDSIRAAFQAWDGFNPASVAIPITRTGGVTSAVIVPRGGLVSGQSAWIDLGQTSVGYARVVRRPTALYINLGAAGSQATGGSRGGALYALRLLYDDVVFYRDHRRDFDANRSRDLAASRLDLQALIPTLGGGIPVVFHARRASDIIRALDFASAHHLRPIISGADEAWMVAKRLAKQKAAVIVNPLDNLPTQFEALGARMDNAAILGKAGVPVILSTFDTHNVRNLRQYAGNAVRAGMSHEAALRAVTLTPAQAFGVSKDYGSLQVGKVANIAVWSGDPFEFSTHVVRLYVAGKAVSLDNRQRRLFERYRHLKRHGVPAAP